MKKFVKILIFTVSIAIIAFSLIKIVNPDILVRNNTSDNSAENPVEIAKWSSEETDNGCKLSFTLYNDNSINMDIEFNKASTNGFYPSDEFYNCQYDSKIIFWEFNYGEKYDSYASIVPNDCRGAEIDGIIYESKSAELQINNKSLNFKYIITDILHSEEHKILLIDEKGETHKEKVIENPFW